MLYFGGKMGWFGGLVNGRVGGGLNVLEAGGSRCRCSSRCG